MQSPLRLFVLGLKWVMVHMLPASYYLESTIVEPPDNDLGVHHSDPTGGCTGWVLFLRGPGLNVLENHNHQQSISITWMVVIVLGPCAGTS